MRISTVKITAVVHFHTLPSRTVSVDFADRAGNGKPDFDSCIMSRTAVETRIYKQLTPAETADRAKIEISLIGAENIDLPLWMLDTNGVLTDLA